MRTFFDWPFRVQLVVVFWGLLVLTLLLVWLSEHIKRYLARKARRKLTDSTIDRVFAEIRATPSERKRIMDCYTKEP
jgi:ABC-type uncharacterized transport system fused permease/ATPase subunit